MGLRQERDTRHYLVAARNQLATARDGLSDAKNHPERRERGLRVAIEFGRGVGEALRHLKGRVHDYESWWGDVRQRYLDNPVCGYLYNLRNDVFHEGTLGTSTSAFIGSLEIGQGGHTVDGVFYPTPSGARSFVIGDANGNDGWIVGSGNRVTHPLKFSASGTNLTFEDAPAEFRYRPATDSIEFWLDRLEEVLNDASERFG